MDVSRTPPATPRTPVSILIAAVGGQGGGVLTGWIVDAADRDGLVAQATSSPGVSQRSGATTYYVEIAPAARPGGTPRTLGLMPVPGRVDVLLTVGADGKITEERAAKAKEHVDQAVDRIIDAKPGSFGKGGFRERLRERRGN